LNGWDGDSALWRVEDGAIVGESKAGGLQENSFLIWRGGTLEPFRIDFKNIWYRKL
jgi:hypothetical protein